jgi:hypothetical protein
MRGTHPGKHGGGEAASPPLDTTNKEDSIWTAAGPRVLLNCGTQIRSIWCAAISRWALGDDLTCR